MAQREKEIKQTEVVAAEKRVEPRSKEEFLSIERGLE